MGIGNGKTGNRPLGVDTADELRRLARRVKKSLGGGFLSSVATRRAVCAALIVSMVASGMPSVGLAQAAYADEPSTQTAAAEDAEDVGTGADELSEPRGNGEPVVAAVTPSGGDEADEEEDTDGVSSPSTDEGDASEAESSDVSAAAAGATAVATAADVDESEADSGSDAAEVDPEIDLSSDAVTGALRLEAEDGQLLYSTDGGKTYTSYTGSITLKGQNTKGDVYVDSGEHNVTLKDVTLESDSSPFDINGYTSVNLTLLGTNSVTGTRQPGILVDGNASLTITAESTGSLTVQGGVTCAGIGGGDYCGTITINGGTVEATGGGYGAGIGGGNGGSGGTIAITGGTVTANGGQGGSGSAGDGAGAGIGGGYNGSGGTIRITGGVVTANGGYGNSGTSGGAGIGGKTGGSITITDGEVTATGGNWAAGIGGASGGNGGAIKIEGGTVTANGGESAAGIGSSTGSYNAPIEGGTITITGGTVTANGGSGISVNDGGAGIGGGRYSNGGTIRIGGGTVTATGGNFGAGIGSGYSGVVGQIEGGAITIAGGEVTANGGSWAAGIGGGYSGLGGAITIEEGAVTATGGHDGAGIGGGFGGAGGTITILGGTATATGGHDGAGIGGGNHGAGGAITIGGGRIAATGGGYGAGIGGGYGGNGGDITISGGTIWAVSEGYYEGIGGGRDGSSGTIVITGGNVSAYDVINTPTDGKGKELQAYMLTLDGVDGSIPVTDLAGLTGVEDYGLNDVVTLEGKLYFYLPEGGNVRKVTAGGETYVGSLDGTYRTGTYSIPDPVADVTMDGVTTTYNDLVEAFESVKAGDTATITLIGNAELFPGEHITVSGNVTLAGGEFTISGAYDSFEAGLVTVPSDAALTIQSGTIKNATSEHALAVVVDGGSLTLQDGAVEAVGNRAIGLYVGAGSARISGGRISGTADGTDSEAGTGLFANPGTTVITGGTFTGSSNAVVTEDGSTVSDLLEPGYAYYLGETAGGTPVEGSGFILADDTYTVGQCTSHQCDSWSDLGDVHGGLCVWCHQYLKEAHTYDENGTCTVCGYQAAVSVTAGDTTDYYTTIEEAWAAAKGNPGGATVTLRTNVVTNNTLYVEDGDDITLTSAGSVDYPISAFADIGYVVVVDGGALTLEKGTLSMSTDKKMAVRVFDGEFTMTGGVIKTYTGQALVVTGGTVQLSGGQIDSSRPAGTAIQVTGGRTVGDLLAKGYGYKQDGSWVTDTSVTSLSGTITVEQTPIQSFDLTASKTELAYGDDAPTLTATAVLADGIDEDSVTYRWSLNGKELEGAAGSTYAPGKLNAGEYTYTCTATADGYSVSRSVTVTVGRIDISDATVELADSLIYSGEEQEQKVNVTVGGVELTEGTDYVLSGSTGTDAGDYTLTVAGTGNYAGSVELEFTIAKRNVYVGHVSLVNRPYDPNSWNMDATVRFDDFVGRDDIKGIQHTVTVTLSDDNSAGDEKPVDIIVTVTDPNYQLCDSMSASPIAHYDEHTDTSIAKADAPAVPEQSRAYVRDVSATGTIDLGELLPEHRGETTYTVTGTDGVVTGTVDGDTLTYTTVENDAVATGTITVTATMQNYEDATITVGFDLVDGLTVTGLPDSATYGDAPFTLTAEGGVGDGAVTWSTSDSEVATVDDGGVVTLTGAGDVTITATKAGGANDDADAVVPVTFTVAKRAVTVSGITAEDKVYDGTRDAVLITEDAAFDGLLDGDVLAVAGTGAFADANAGTGKTVAITDLVLVGADVRNYELAADGQQVETAADIAPKAIAVDITPGGGVYGGKIASAKAEPVGVVEGDTVDVALTYTGIANDGTEVDCAEAPELAGTYTVTASIEEGNYSLIGDMTADFTVARADAGLSVSPKRADATFGDAALALSVEYEGDGAVTYTSSDDRVATVDASGTVTLIGAGEATVTVTLGQTANYEGGEVSVAVSVAKKDDVLTVEGLSYEVIYGDAGFNIAYEAESGGKAAFVSSDASVVTVDAEGNVEIVGVGEAVVTVATAGDGNYLATSEDVRITVAPRPVTVAAESAFKVYGDEDPALGWSVTGGSVVPGDELEVSVAREPGEDAGEYALRVFQEAGANPNYSIEFADGVFAIERRSIEGAEIELGSVLMANGAEQEQQVKRVAVENAAGEELEATFEVSGNRAVEPGVYELTVTGTGNFCGSETKAFVVLALPDPEDPGTEEPTDPEEPGPGPTDPTDPDEPEIPVDPDPEPTDPDEPGTDEPGVDPDEPEDPVVPTDPDEPGDPSDPDDPTDPDKPVEPSDPDEPEIPGPTVPGDAIEIGEGAIDVVVESASGAPAVAFKTSKAQLIRMLVEDGSLTADELSLVVGGAKLDVVVYVQDASQVVSDETRALIEGAAGDMTVGCYFDVSLAKRFVRNGEVEREIAIEQTSQEIEVSVRVPDELLNRDPSILRTLWIVREHDGAVDFLPCTFDAEDLSLTFKTDRFSIYAIAYSDRQVGGGEEVGSGGQPSTEEPSTGSVSTGASDPASRNTATGELPPTGDAPTVLAASALAAAGAVALGGAIWERKRRHV